MIARPKMSQNEWKTTEIRASKVGISHPFPAQVWSLGCVLYELGDSTRLHTLRQALKDLKKEALELEVSIGIALQQNAHIWRQKHRMVHKDPFHDDDDGFEVDSLLTDSVS